MNDNLNIALELKNIEKSYGKLKVLKNLSATVKDKGFLVLVGPSGCGKTTLLRIIAGLIPPNSGEVILKGKVINDLPAHKRDMGLVFQNYALFPHMNVYKNVAFGLRMRNVSKDDILSRVEKALELVHLEGLGDRDITKLSGGQQQRVALARALVLNPSLLLLDEPLSNLDAKLRQAVRVEIAQIQKEIGITTILVTHDQTEALTMGDHILLMNEGEILQSADPIEIYDHPCNVFVATFIGSPQMNLFDLEVSAGNGLLNEISTLIPQQKLAPCWKDLANDETGIPDGQYILGIRSEDFDIQLDAVDEAMIKAEVVFIEMLGSDTYLHLKSGEKAIIARLSRTISSVRIGDQVGLNICSQRAHLFDAATKERFSVS